jgi:hypothetical protein
MRRLGHLHAHARERRGPSFGEDLAARVLVHVDHLETSEGRVGMQMVREAVGSMQSFESALFEESDQPILRQSSDE